MSETESTTDRFEYTLTGRALRQIKAEVWEEAIHHVDGSLFAEVKRAAMLDNPYRVEAPAMTPQPPAAPEGERDEATARAESAEAAHERLRALIRTQAEHDETPTEIRARREGENR